jgi:hypothetical protein
MILWLCSKLLHNNHYLLMDLKQRFLFAFSMNLRKVRDLSIQQRKKLVPLWIAQASLVVFLPLLIFHSAAGALQ